MSESERWDAVLAAFAVSVGRVSLGASDCWPWNDFCVERNAYGTFMHRGLGDYAHRLSYRLAFGVFPDGGVVRHTCDWKPCVNPAHLVGGTHTDNMRDASERGRLGPFPKISDAQVRELDTRYRAGGVSMTQLAREYGVSVPTVSEIINRKKRARAFAVS